jgi:hypothetical protein
MRQIRFSTVTLCTALAALTAPLSAQPPGNEGGPCEQIVAACKKAGFIEGDYRTGNGLHVDCIDPIMRGTAQPPKAKIPLPAVSPQLVAACKQKRPNFGEPKQHPPGPPPGQPTNQPAQPPPGQPQ